MCTIPQRNIFPSLLLERYEDRLEAGRCMLEARDDTLVYLSLFGSYLFKRGIDILRDAGMIQEFEKIYFGGRGCVGVTCLDPDVPYRDRYFELPSDEIEEAGIMLDTDGLLECDQPREEFLGKFVTHPRVPVTRLVPPDRMALCRFCFTPLSSDTLVPILPCEHWYCSGCLSGWLYCHDSCPECCESVGRPLEPWSCLNLVKYDKQRRRNRE